MVDPMDERTVEHWVALLEMMLVDVKVSMRVVWLVASMVWMLVGWMVA